MKSEISKPEPPEKKRVPPPPDQPTEGAYFQGTDRTHTDPDLASEEDE
jgi:hypothetical protein